MKRILSSVAIFASIFLVNCSSSSTVTDDVAVSYDAYAELHELVAGKPSIVNFWASWCTFCKEELPLFEAVHLAHPEIAVVGVNLQEKDSTATAYWSEGGYTFPTIQDPEADLKARLDVFTQPTTFFVTSHDDVVFQKNGPLTEEELENWVGKLLEAEAALAVVDTPVFDDSSDISDATIEQDIQVSDVPGSLRRWYDDRVQHLIPLDDILSGGPPKDGIPSIDNPTFLTVSEAESFLEDDDVGLLLAIENDIRFYPYKILNWHEIVNDRVGKLAVAVTYCPLCATGVVYDRTISTGLVEFGVSGFLYQSNLLMYDRGTDTLWNQATAQAVVGPLTGERLTMIPSDVVRFKTVKANYTTAQVLNNTTGFFRDYTRDPYDGYETEQRLFFPVQASDDRLPNKELVYGLVVNGAAKAYPLSTLQSQASIADIVAEQSLAIEYDTARESLTITNTTTGERLVALPVFWFSWVAQHPETELFEQ